VQVRDDSNHAVFAQSSFLAYTTTGVTAPTPTKAPTQGAFPPASPTDNGGDASNNPQAASASVVVVAAAAAAGAVVVLLVCCWCSRRRGNKGGAGGAGDGGRKSGASGRGSNSVVDSSDTWGPLALQSSIGGGSLAGGGFEIELAEESAAGRGQAGSRRGGARQSMDRPPQSPTVAVAVSRLADRRSNRSRSQGEGGGGGSAFDLDYEDVPVALYVSICRDCLALHG